MYMKTRETCCVAGNFVTNIRVSLESLKNLCQKNSQLFGTDFKIWRTLWINFSDQARIWTSLSGLYEKRVSKHKSVSCRNLFSMKYKVLDVFNSWDQKQPEMKNFWKFKHFFQCLNKFFEAWIQKTYSEKLMLRIFHIETISVLYFWRKVNSEHLYQYCDSNLQFTRWVLQCFRFRLQICTWKICRMIAMNFFRNLNVR